MSALSAKSALRWVVKVFAGFWPRARGLVQSIFVRSPDHQGTLAPSLVGELVSPERVFCLFDERLAYLHQPQNH